MQTPELPVHDIPALSGNNAPVHEEDVFEDLAVIGEMPRDFAGLYVRNGPNAFFAPGWRYHAYDGDGMLHAVHFDHGRVSYRNCWIRTEGLREEQAAGRTLWKGLKEPFRTDRPDQPLKNTSNTDVKFHAGRLLSMWYRSGMPYAVDPMTLETLGVADYGGAVSRISAHSRPDEHTGELLWFDYAMEPPYMRYGVIGPDRQARHEIEIPLPGPNLPHDMAVTERHTILHDFPLRLDMEAMAAGRYKVRFHPDEPSRFAVVPRYGQASDIRWFEAKPGYMLHVVNAWDEGEEVVMVGTPYRLYHDVHGRIDARRLERTINQRQRDFLLYEWRFDLRSGQTRERVIDDVLNTEFPVINGAYQGRRNRWSYHIVFPPGGREEPRFPGLVKYDLQTGGYIAYSAGPQYFYNEPGFAPRDDPRSEDDGYLVTLAWNPVEVRSEIQVFDCLGARLAEGPVARLPLPRRVPNGFHATYVSQRTLDRWK
ncbi:carotenoid oxygenase family protein [Ramlibacter rhizophilus]|uniref:Apocarotenoid-15,15'-oxygenase n=1 Tax=Ramlibacter rhizophilus TaxID=1781167 RepID=A0A4Z0BF61_9BURK|nr:carotenoid oxygenase family protein [Ramlibacter rhizophilus]TFY97966.1 apocarotenoid-15,15'-oxygenase [Ramlibacter rhizophilus]